MENSLEETIQQKKSPIAALFASRKKNFSVRNHLLYHLIFAIGIPLVLATFWGYIFIKKNTEKTINNRLSKEIILTQNIIDLSLEQATAIPRSMSDNPAVIEAIKEANKVVIADNLTALPISSLESKFSSTKLLQENIALNTYLQNTAKNNHFAEIFITDRFGFNVAYSQPTSDFVQQDEAWWQQAKNNSQYISESELDASSNTYGISLIQAINEPHSKQFLGVVKTVLPLSQIEKVSNQYFKNTDFSDSQQIQIIDTKANKIITTIGKTKSLKNAAPLTPQAISEIARILQQTANKPQTNSNYQAIFKQIPKEIGLKNLSFDNSNLARLLSCDYQKKKYIITSIPNTSFLITASIDRAEFTTVANQSLWRFLLVIIGIAIAIISVIILLARAIGHPLQELVVKVQEATSGNLEVRADLAGTTETITLAHNFNNLIEQVQESLEKQTRILNNAENTRREAERVAEEQKAKNARIQQELLELLGDVEGASSGDLTVRSRINDGEIGIVADFFNSIIESIRDIVAQVKEGAEQVDFSVGENKKTISNLAIEASQQADRITETLASVEQITQSIQQVAYNAQEAAEVAHIASNKAEKGGKSMELTVNSIKQLQKTIDQTAAKVKTLGEASQQISRVISLIDQIAMQTNLLSINASIEAARAGEEGKGFAVVAEEVGALATQSSDATKEVGTIIVGIQKEIAQVVEAMEIGIIQAEEGTRLVENTKESLQQIVEVSYQIDNLVQAISQTTVSQAETSRNVTQLMEQIAQISEQTSSISQNASNSLESTVAIAEKLKSSVGTFKVQEE
jgi:methyl-accepting chemotaxis protein PixJ